jgi:hypothetical protein
MALWKARHELGHYPLLASAPRYTEDIQEMFRKNPTARLLRRGLAMSAEEFLKKRERDFAEVLRDAGYHGAWPSKRPAAREFSSGSLEIAGIRDLKKLWVLLLPAGESWEAMAHHCWGGWNDAPAPEALVCLLKSWHDRFGAEWVADGGDFLEFYVARPPRTREAALALATELFTVCVDIVDQGCGTVEALAHELLGSGSWFLWWD